MLYYIYNTKMQRPMVNANPFPVIEPQQNVGVSDVQVTDESEEDLLINNLIYSMPKSLSLATSRSYVRMYPEQKSAISVGRNTIVTSNWNTGNNYINCANSFLKFRVNPLVFSGVAVSNAGFATGSAINLFNNFTASSKSGTQLAKSENTNQWARNNVLYTHSQQWINTIGKAFGVDSGTDAGMSDTESVYYTIPLVELDPFFSTHKNLLLPPQLASGLRIELGLENPDRACRASAGGVTGITTMTLDQFEWVLDAVMLSDDTQRVLNLESSQTGLEVSYRRVYKVSNALVSGSTEANVQLIKAVAQAETCFVQITNPDNDNKIQFDSFASVGYNIASSQFRLGSLYFPQQPTRDSVSVGTGGAENYLMALQAFDKLRHPFQEPSVTFVDYIADPGKGILAVSFEKNQDLSVSGLSINNSRVLEVLLTFSAALSANRTITLFLTYCSVSKCFIDNTAVAI